jgi:uncharacterized membrane protein
VRLLACINSVLVANLILCFVAKLILCSIGFVAAPNFILCLLLFQHRQHRQYGLLISQEIRSGDTEHIFAVLMISFDVFY